MRHTCKQRQQRASRMVWRWSNDLVSVAAASWRGCDCPGGAGLLRRLFGGNRVISDEQLSATWVERLPGAFSEQRVRRTETDVLRPIRHCGAVSVLFVLAASSAGRADRRAASRTRGGAAHTPAGLDTKRHAMALAEGEGRDGIRR